MCTKFYNTFLVCPAEVERKTIMITHFFNIQITVDHCQLTVPDTVSKDSHYAWSSTTICSRHIANQARLKTVS